MENVKIKRGGHFYGIGTLLCYYYLLIFKNDFRLIASFTPRKRVMEVFGQRREVHYPLRLNERLKFHYYNNIQNNI